MFARTSLLTGDKQIIMMTLTIYIIHCIAGRDKIMTGIAISSSNNLTCNVAQTKYRNIRNIMEYLLFQVPETIWIVF